MDAGVLLLVVFGLIGFGFYLLFTALIQWVAVMMMGSQASYLIAVKVQLVTVLLAPLCFGLVLGVLVGILSAVGGAALLTPVIIVGGFAYLVYICKYMMEAYGIGFLALIGSWLLVLCFNFGLSYLAMWGLLSAGYSEQEIVKLFDFSQYLK
ncbi:MAG: hypothetical protein KDI30_08585 [Pseudomonadales bacterium]|nr:hypothetical protein [Pseudomonadales bacterium]